MLIMADTSIGPASLHGSTEAPPGAFQLLPDVVYSKTNVIRIVRDTSFSHFPTHTTIPKPKVITTETDLRPWLAWSAPSPTHQALALPSFNYNTVDWKSVLEGRYGVGETEVDGIIFAAKMIDDSFTLIEPLSNNNNHHRRTHLQWHLLRR